MSAPQPPVNLNPANAVPSLPAQKVTVAALRSEAARGSERIWFNIPHRLKSMVNMYVSEPGNEFQGAHANFYALAVARLLQEHAPFMRHDQEYTRTIRQLESLSRTLSYEEPCEDFRRRLAQAEKAAEVCMPVKNWTFGFTLLDAAVTVVQESADGLRAAFATDLRGSRPMQDLMRALVDDDVYGRSDAVHRLQKWMADA